MPDQIYLPVGLTNANVIKVGGECYERVGERSAFPTVHFIDEEHFSCLMCEDSSGCSSDGTPCEYCDDLTTSQYTVTFSSGVPAFELCEGCIPLVDARYAWATDSSVFLNSHLLTQVPTTPCSWTTTIVAALENTTYSSSTGSCSGSSSTGLVDITITLTRSDTQWHLLASTVFDDVLFENVVDANEVGGTQLCATVPAMANRAETCGVETGTGGFDLTGPAIATGGTATVVCV